MSLKKHEKTILEAITGIMNERTVLGLPKDTKEVSHTSQHRYESIRDQFALQLGEKLPDTPFHDALTAAFNAVHAYKYIDHPTFCVSFEAQCRSMAIPTHECEKACQIIKSMVEKLSVNNPSERDAGYNRDILGKVRDVTTYADTHGGDRSPPFTGGGPWADKAEVASENHMRYAKLLVVEGVIGEHDKLGRDLAMRFFSLKTRPYIQAKAELSKLAVESYKADRRELHRKIIDYIQLSDSAISESIFEK